MSEIKADSELDCRGLNCPLPIVKTKKAIEGLQSGEILKVVTTDPGAVADLGSWARITGNTLVSSEEGKEECTFFIKKK